MATTEEMNIVLARYENRLFASRYKIDDYLGTPNVTPNMSYNTSWDWLMPVWDKLRDEYDKLPKTVMLYSVEMARNEDAVKKAIVEVDITEAHRLIYEAIVWLNQNKPK